MVTGRNVHSTGVIPIQCETSSPEGFSEVMMLHTGRVARWRQWKGIDAQVAPMLIGLQVLAKSKGLR